MSGQIRAQGQLAKVQGVASGFSNGFQAYEQNKMRNQILQGENEGMLKVFMQDEETKKYAPAGIEKFLQKAESGGGMTLDDNIRFNGMLNSALKTRGVIDQQNQAQQQMEMQKQKMSADLAKTTQEAQQYADMMAQQKRLRRYGDFMNNPGNFNSDEQRRMSMELFGVPNQMDVAATEPDEATPAGGSEALRRAVEMFSATGQVPASNTMLQDDSRRMLDEERNRSREAIAELKNANVSGYASTEDAIKAAREMGVKNYTIVPNANGRHNIQPTFRDAGSAKPETMMHNGREYIKKDNDWELVKPEFVPTTPAGWRALRANSPLSTIEKDAEFGKSYGEFIRLEREDMASVMDKAPPPPPPSMQINVPGAGPMQAPAQGTAPGVPPMLQRPGAVSQGKPITPELAQKFINEAAKQANGDVILARQIAREMAQRAGYRF